MTAARSTRTAIRRCRSASAAAAAPAAAAAASAGPNGEPFEFSGGGEAADISDLFEGLFGGGGAARRRRRRAVRRLRPAPRAAAEGRRRRLPARGRRSRTRRGSTGQRVTLAGGKTLDIKLPPGVEDGTKIRLAGQGQPGPGGNGDAIVTIAIKPHRFFTREGDNIRLDLPVSLDEAVLGGKVRVPTVDGPVMLSVPKGSSSGKVLRLKGKGFTGKNGQRGDQLVTLDGRRARTMPSSPRFLEGWSGHGQGQPARGRWASSASCATISPESPEARRKRLAPAPRRSSGRSGRRAGARGPGR